MVAAIASAVISSLAGSLLWRVALILGVFVLVVWIIRRHGTAGKPAYGNSAVILLIALCGAAAGAGYGALDRSAESAKHTKERARIEAQNATLAAELDAARRDAEALRANAEHDRKLADAAATRAADSDKRVIAAQRERSAAMKNLSRRVSDVSKNADGSLPTVGTDWVRDYNAALGFELPTIAADPRDPGGPADPAYPAGAGKEGQVTTADVLQTHITNAEAARDSADRLTGLQSWYNAMRTERNTEPTEEETR